MIGWRRWLNVIALTVSVCSPTGSNCLGATIPEGESISELVGGVESEIVVHETGHWLVGSLQGRQIKSYRPYPHRIATGGFVGGSVEASSAPAASDRERARADAWFAAAGSTTSLLGVLVLAPLVSQLDPSTFGARLLNYEMQFSLLDWPMYALVDIPVIHRWTGSKVDGDWAAFARSTGLSPYLITGLAVVASAVVAIYYNHWAQQSEHRYPGSSYTQTAPIFGLHFGF